MFYCLHPLTEEISLLPLNHAPGLERAFSLFLVYAWIHSFC